MYWSFDYLKELVQRTNKTRKPLRFPVQSLKPLVQPPRKRFIDELDRAFPVKTGTVHLQLVKSRDREVVCDQDGRELAGVQGFRYEQADVESVPVLIIKLVVSPSKWSPDLGVKKDGEEVDLEPSSL
jgi:hypothetical protein